MSAALAAELADPAFWVNVAIAIGTIGAAGVALWLGLRASFGDKARKAVEIELELRRQSELQAVSIRFEDGGSSGSMNGFSKNIRIYNGSDKAIFDVHAAAVVDGKELWSSGVTQVEPGQPGTLYVTDHPRFTAEKYLGNFVDAYGRKWTVDANRGLKLEGSYPVSATPEAWATLGKSAE